MALRDLATVLVRLYGLLLFFYCLQMSQQALVYITSPAPSDALFKIWLFSTVAGGFLDGITGVCLLVFARPIAVWVAPKTSDGSNIMVSPSDLALISFSLAGIVFFVDGIGWFAHNLVAWYFSPKNFVATALLDPKMTGSLAMSTVKVVVGLLLLFGSKGILRTVRWIRLEGGREEKTKGETAGQAITELPNIPKCPNCGAEYNPKDYREDALEWFCLQCKKTLPKSNP